MAKRKQKKNMKPVLAVVGAMFTFLILALPVTMKAMQTNLFQSFGVVQLFSTQAEEFNEFEELKFEYEMTMNEMQDIEVAIQDISEKKKYLMDDMSSEQSEDVLKRIEMEVQEIEEMEKKMYEELARAQENLQSIEMKIQHLEKELAEEKMEEKEEFHDDMMHDEGFDHDKEFEEELKEELERKKMEEHLREEAEKRLHEEKLREQMHAEEKEQEFKEDMDARKRAEEKLREERGIDQRLENSVSCKEQVLRKLAGENLSRLEINKVIERECAGDVRRRVVDHRQPTDSRAADSKALSCKEEVFNKYKGRNIDANRLEAMVEDLCGMEDHDDRRDVLHDEDRERFDGAFHDEFFDDERADEEFDRELDEKFEDDFWFEEGLRDDHRDDLRPKEDLERMREDFEARLRMKKRDREFFEKERERHAEHGDHFGGQIEAELERSVGETEEALKEFENKLTRCEQYYNLNEKEKYLTCTDELDVIHLEQDVRDVKDHARMMDQDAEQFRKMVEEYKEEARRQGTDGASAELDKRVEELKAIVADVSAAKAELEAALEKVKANAGSEDMDEFMKEYERVMENFQEKMQKMEGKEFYIPEEKWEEVHEQRFENYTDSSVDFFRERLMEAERIAEKFAQAGADISGLKKVLNRAYDNVNEAQARLDGGKDPERVVEELEKEMKQRKAEFDRAMAQVERELDDDRADDLFTEEEERFIAEDDFMNEDDVREQFKKHHSGATSVEDMLDKMSEDDMRKMVKRFLKANPDALEKFAELKDLGINEERLQRAAKNVDLDTFVERKEKVRDEVEVLNERLEKKYRSMRPELEEIKEFVLAHPLSEEQTKRVKEKMADFIDRDERGELTPEDISNLKRWLHEDVKPRSVEELYKAGEAECIDRAPDEWDYESIKYLKEQGVVSGRPGGACDSGSNVRVSELAKMVVEASELEANDSVISGEWYAKYMSARGLDVPSDPGKIASRAEAVRALVRAFDPEMGDVSSRPYFKDINEDHHAFKQVQWAVENGIIDKAETFGDRGINRAEFFTIIKRMMEWEAEHGFADYDQFGGADSDAGNNSDSDSDSDSSDAGSGLGTDDAQIVAAEGYNCVDYDFEGSDFFSQIETAAAPYEAGSTVGQKGSDPSEKAWNDYCAGNTLREYYCEYGVGYLGDTGLHVEREDVDCGDLTDENGNPLSCLTDAEGLAYCG